MKLVLASRNPKKLAEMEDILTGLGVEVLSAEAAGASIEVEETGESFEENALLKARAVMEATGLPAVADDSGLAVDALGGGPGVYSARYGGPELDDRGRVQLLLSAMSGQTKRGCRFVSAICCVFPDGAVLRASGTCEGMVAFAPQGDFGFGYDPVFFLPALKKTMAQLSPEEKNAISHRGHALRAFKLELERYLYGTD